jgi:hypothetical protein
VEELYAKDSTPCSLGCAVFAPEKKRQAINFFDLLPILLVPLANGESGGTKQAVIYMTAKT